MCVCVRVRYSLNENNLIGLCIRTFGLQLVKLEGIERCDLEGGGVLL